MCLGACQCRPGWKASGRCSERCSQGTFGVNCTQHCKCQNGGKCRANDGICRCVPGWTGARCTEICPEGYYGDHCMEPCECLNDNFICHPADGCICRYGYSGSNCDDELFSRNVKEKTESNYSSIIAGIFTANLLIAIAIAACMYHRKRVANLKMEIAHVQYTAEPVIPSDHNHFDNPVYSYQGPTRSDDGTATLLNNGLIRNNLGMKSINSERDKFSGDDEESFKGAYGSQCNNNNNNTMKNRDADVGNPNVYHSIDEMDNKKAAEHLYDEIKQNNNGELEYDHLDYTRPMSAWKPHYQRMSNGFGSNKDGSGSSKGNQFEPEPSGS